MGLTLARGNLRNITLSKQVHLREICLDIIDIGFSHELQKLYSSLSTTLNRLIGGSSNFENMALAGNKTL